MADGLNRQSSAWAWGGVLASAVAILPAVTARVHGGWVAPMLVLPVALLVEYLMKPARGCGLSDWFRGVLGAPIGRVLTFIYIMWAAVLGGTQLWICARRVARGMEPAWSRWLLTVLLALLALWFVRGGPAACARWAKLALSGVLVVLGMIALLALMQVRRGNLLPLWSGGQELATAIGASVGVVCVRVYGGFVPCGEERDARRYPVLVCGLLSLLLLAVQGGLGTVLAGRLEDPLLTLSRNVGVRGTFRRVESVLAAALVVADLILLTMLMWAAKLAAKRAWPLRNEAWIAWVIGAVAVGIALLPAEQMQMQRFCRGVVPGVQIALGLIIPLGVFLVERIKARRAAHLVPEKREKGTY